MKMLTLTKPSSFLASARTASPLQINLPGIQVRELEGDRWDRFASNFKDVIHEQTSCFNHARNKADDLKHIAVYRNGNPIGGALAKLFKLPGLSPKVAIIRWGPLWRPFGSEDSVQNLKTVYQAVTQLLTHQHNCFVLVIPKADPDHSDYEQETLAKLGFKPTYQPESPERYFVNVDQSPEEIKASFSQKWRSHLRKSERSNLSIEFLDRDEGLPVFMELYQSMVERKNFLETSPIETLKDLLNSKTEALRPKIVIARHGNMPVAGAILDLSGERAIYLYGATNEAALGLRAGYAIHWAIIRHLAEIPEIRWYDLGGGTGKDCSLHQFKRGMVGKCGVIAPVPDYHAYSASLGQYIIGTSLLKLELSKSRIHKALHEKRLAFSGK